MEFTLFYKGELKGRNSATPTDKQRIRREVHKQMARLWQLEPLLGNRDYVSTTIPLVDVHGVRRISLVEQFGPFTFAPLISANLFLAAKLDITLLRPERPGRIFDNRGDIDNQVKTLLDALSMPQQLNQLPVDDRPNTDEMPFFCLLQNDSLVTSVAVNTGRLLASDQSDESNDVVVLVHVKTIVTKPVMAALEFL